MNTLNWHWYAWREWPTDRLYEVLRLRSAIFVVEQNCVFHDMDGLDPRCEHLCGLDAAGAVVAYARLLPPGLKYPEASIGRVIVAESARARKLGHVLMIEALNGCAARFPDAAVIIGAQQRLEAFYAAHGFVPVGEPYLEDGIRHIDMRLASPRSLYSPPRN